jgi:tetratricopeptide (TPR) repeat protein
MQCLLAEARLLVARGERDSALQTARGAVTVAEAAGDTSSGDFADVIEGVSLQLHGLNRLRDALVMNTRTIATLNRIGRGSTFRMLLAHYDRALNLRDLGELTSADSSLTEAVRLAQRIGPEHAASLLANMAGEVAYALDRPDSAIRAFERGLAAGRRVGNRERQRWALERLVSIYADYGPPARAKAYYAQLIALVPDTVELLGIYQARIALLEGRHSEAFTLYRDALVKQGFPDAPEALHWHRVAQRLGSVALLLHDPAAADSLARHALRMEHALGHDDRTSGDIGNSLALLARARLDKGDSAGARSLLQQAMPALLSGFGPAHFRTRAAKALADSL